MTASGSIALPVEKLAYLVSLSSTFQAGRSFTDALNESIDYGQRDISFFAEGIQPERPLCVVDNGGHGFRLDAGGGQNQLRAFGEVWLWLEYDWPESLADDPMTARRNAWNYFGAVIDEVMANAGNDVSATLGFAFDDGSGGLSIIGCRQEIMGQTDPDEFAANERYFMAGYRVEWGDGA